MEGELLPPVISACEKAQYEILILLQASDNNKPIVPYQFNRHMTRLMECLEKLALAIQLLHSQPPPTNVDDYKSEQGDDDEGEGDEDEGDEDEGDEDEGDEVSAVSSSSSFSSSPSERNTKVKFTFFDADISMATSESKDRMSGSFFI